ncbi:unnamed protein product [Arctia plantaginis]|uniref:Uncharacterized protein n=1 Tax=Arctia plantaginis TaxID=874455 RepID=A0A8S1BRG9_ARCPL|nr:unnamed protein product [Arctia plantaginis]
MKVLIDDEEYLVDLRLNLELVTENHVLSYQNNGTTVLYKPHKEDDWATFDETEFQGPHKANEGPFYVELVLVVDRSYFEAYNRKLCFVHKQMQTIANILTRNKPRFLNFEYPICGNGILDLGEQFRLQCDDRSWYIPPVLRLLRSKHLYALERMLHVTRASAAIYRGTVFVSQIIKQKLDSAYNRGTLCTMSEPGITAHPLPTDENSTFLRKTDVVLYVMILGTVPAILLIICAYKVKSNQ